MLIDGSLSTKTKAEKWVLAESMNWVAEVASATMQHVTQNCGSCGWTLGKSTRLLLI